MPAATKKDEREDLIAVLVMLVLFGVATWISWGFSPKARLAPFFISASCVVFLLLDLAHRYLGRQDTAPAGTSGVVQRDLGTVTEASGPAGQAESVRPADLPLHSSFNAMFTILAPFVAMIFLIGILPAAVLFILGYIRIVAKSSLMSAAIYAAATFLVLRTLFVGLLGIFMYRGVFGLYIPFISG